MQNFKSSNATVIELRFFLKKKMKMRKSYLPVLHTSCDSFMHAVSFFYMFSTLMSLEDRSRLELKVRASISLCMPIMLDHPYIHSTTVLCDTVP